MVIAQYLQVLQNLFSWFMAKMAKIDFVKISARKNFCTEGIKIMANIWFANHMRSKNTEMTILLVEYW